ncbi:MAG: hypothetical protein Aureis2KO_04110 [Aureisphaera sp.]
MIHYILQVVACQLLFLAVYDLFLKKETFFNLNRAYLLATPLVSILIPFIEIALIRESVPEVYQIKLPEIVIGWTGNTEEVASGSLSWLQLIWIIGVLGSLGLFAFKWFRYVQLRKKGRASKQFGFTLIEIPNTTMAFSFFKNIFLGQDLSEKQRKSILQHEQVHVKEKHTWDLLWFEILRIIFWFNPLIYVFQKRITALQEYIADKKAMDHHGKRDYYENLLSTIFQTESISFINTFFNHSLIKNRIVMLQKSKSKNIAKWKYLWILPVLGLMLTYVSCAEGNAMEEDSSLDMVEVESIDEQGTDKDKQKTYAFTELDKIPVYPGCEDLAPEDAKGCFTKKIAMFVHENFNTKISNKEINGRQRIAVKFKIDKYGNVTDVDAKAQYTELMDEAIRVAKLLPKMTPGEHEGKKVAVQYALPILFEIE